MYLPFRLFSLFSLVLPVHPKPATFYSSKLRQPDDIRKLGPAINRVAELDRRSPCIGYTTGAAPARLDKPGWGRIDDALVRMTRASTSRDLPR
jgi:hypothetical protein